MKNMEVTHTLRLYDAEFIAKLGSLMEKELRHYRNKNDFMTAVLKMGYERYVNAMSEQTSRQTGADATEKPFTERMENLSPATPFDENVKDIYPLLSELSKYVEAHYNAITTNHTVIQKLLSSIYNIVVAISDGERLMPTLLNDGYYDDLPARFEKIIVKLETNLGIK